MFFLGNVLPIYKVYGMLNGQNYIFLFVTNMNKNKCPQTAAKTLRSDNETVWKQENERRENFLR